MKLKILSMLTVCVMSLSMAVPSLAANTTVVNKSDVNINGAVIGTYQGVENNQTSIYNSGGENSDVTVLNIGNTEIKDSIIGVLQTVKQNTTDITNLDGMGKTTILNSDNLSINDSVAGQINNIKQNVTQIINNTKN